MAPRQDDMEQRRRRRAALEKKRMEQQKKLRRKLILAAVILLACAALVLYLTPGGEAPSASGETMPEQPQFTAPPEERATLPPETPTTTIHIKAAGDLNITDKVVESGKASYGDYYDYTAAFMDVAPILSDADLTMLNFEGNLVGPPYGTETASAPVELVEALDAVGVDILQMANSYSIYNGMIGLAQTLNNIRSTGIEPVGAFATPAEFQQSRVLTHLAALGLSCSTDLWGFSSATRDRIHICFDGRQS